MRSPSTAMLTKRHCVSGKSTFLSGNCSLQAETGVKSRNSESLQYDAFETLHLPYFTPGRIEVRNLMMLNTVSPSWNRIFKREASLGFSFQGPDSTSCCELFALQYGTAEKGSSETACSRRLRTVAIVNYTGGGRMSMRRIKHFHRMVVNAPLVSRVSQLLCGANVPGGNGFVQIEYKKPIQANTMGARRMSQTGTSSCNV